MNCDDFQARLNDEFDVASTRNSGDLAEHASQCAACRTTWDGFRLLSDCIGAWRQETPDVDLAQAIVFAMSHSTDPTSHSPNIESRASPISTQRRRQRSLATSIAAAAVLVIVAALLPVLRPGPQSITPVAQNKDRHRDLAVSSEKRSDENGGLTPQMARPHAPQSDTDRLPYYDLAQRAAGALGQMTMLVLPADPAPHNPTQDPPAAAPAGWMDDFEHQLKPVGRSLENAFDFLWRAGESVDG